ncbi:MAG: hypothetical protein KDD45_12935 [Bdellovibrionales bacterium]|nr:hypothetical protein [Bdellovibrionales bacterium]
MFNQIGSAKVNNIESSKKDLSSVELQWEDSKYATHYQVQVFNSKKKYLKTFNSKTSLIKFKSTSGKIKIRGRFKDVYGNYSDWSQFIDVEVPPEPVRFGDSKNLSLEKLLITSKASNKTLKGKVDLKWSEAPQAKKYKIKVYDKDKNIINEFITSNSSFTLDLEAGTYTFSITSYGNDNIVGKESFSPQKILVKSAQLADLPFDIEKSKQSNSFKILIPQEKNVSIIGKLEYSHHLVENWKVVESLKNLSEFWQPDNNLVPGRYKISLWGSKIGWQNSNPYTYEFVIKPTEAAIKEIESKY